MPKWAWELLTIAGFVVAVDGIANDGWVWTVVGAMGLVLFLRGIEHKFVEKL